MSFSIRVLKRFFLILVTVDFSRDNTADTGGFEVVHQISLRERGKRNFWDDIPGNFVDIPNPIETGNDKENHQPESQNNDVNMEEDDDDEEELVEVRPKRVLRDDIKNVLDLKWVGFHKMTNDKKAMSGAAEERKKPLDEKKSSNIRKKKLKTSKK